MQRTTHFLLAAAMLSALGCGDGSTIGSQTEAAKQAEEPSLVGGSFSTCFWNYGAVGVEPEFNIAYPDAGASYWAAYYRRPAGSTLELVGTYPHSRYMSFISYDALGQPVDGIADYQIDPDPGSENPFRPGADRNTPKGQRDYSIQVAHAKNPGFTIRDPRNDEPPRDTLYTIPTTFMEGGSGFPHRPEVGSDGVTYPVELILYRNYVPDRGFDLTGKVGLPEPILTLADGTVLTGQAACDAMDSESKDLKVTSGDPDATRLPDPSALLLDDARYSALRYPNELMTGEQVKVFPPPGIPGAPLFQVGREVADPVSFPAGYEPNGERSVEWRAQYNRRYLLQQWTGDDAPGAETEPSRTGGGFFPNIHNNYIRAVLHRSFGKVAVVRGKLPTAPETQDHRPTMGAGEVRYASFCMNESVKTTRVMDCVFDEEVPTDEDGFYTIVVSRIEDRPKNAKQACGAAWVEWSPRGDGFEDPDFGWFQIRNMIPDVSFNHAVQNTAVPGDEIEAMGDYLPNVEYYDSAEDYEALKCAGGSR